MGGKPISEVKIMNEFYLKQQKDVHGIMASLLTVDELFKGQYPITKTDIEQKIGFYTKLLKEMSNDNSKGKS